MHDPDVTSLLQPWLAVTGPDTEAVGLDLVRRYAEPHRHYHDVRHLAEVLAALHLLAADPPVPVVLAAYFHDAVYDPRSPDNEARSAELAACQLQGVGQPAAIVEQVVRLVLLTTTHDPEPGDVHGALLSDADLAVLGADDGRYRAYAAGVRAEHGHVDEQDFRRGRSAVLSDLLGRARLYSTAPGRARWDNAARRNLQDELSRLAAAGAAAAPPRAAG